MPVSSHQPKKPPVRSYNYFRLYQLNHELTADVDAAICSFVPKNGEAKRLF
jgi:hypothetical protein